MVRLHRAPFVSISIACCVMLFPTAVPGQGLSPASVRSGNAAQPAFVSPWSGSLRWLGLAAVQQELELVAEQEEGLADLRAEITAEYRGLYQQLRDVPTAERAQRYRELAAELAKRTEIRVQEILLPSQMDRLQQVSLQMRLRSYGGYGGAFTQADMAETLKLSTSQQERIQTIRQDAQQELQRKIRELSSEMREQAGKDVRRVLRPSQVKKLEEMIGEPFEYDPHSRQPKLPVTGIGRPG